MREVRQNRKEILRECGSGKDGVGQTVQLNRLIGIVQIEGAIQLAEDDANRPGKSLARAILRSVIRQSIYPYLL
jgi:hypothetical protein